MYISAKFFKFEQERNKKFHYKINVVKFNSVQCVKNLGVKIETNLKCLQYYTDAAKKLNKNVGLQKKNL